MTLRAGAIVAPVVWLLFPLGCSHGAPAPEVADDAPPLVSAAPPASAARAARPTQVPTIEGDAPPNAAVDHSLSVSGYIQHGLPSPDASWGPPHYRAAIQALAKASRGDATKLPRAASPRSSPVFHRLVARENFKAITAQGPPSRTRSQTATEFWELLPSLLALYARPAEGNALATEHVELAKLMLELGPPSFEHLVEAQRPRLATFAAALASGILTMLGETDTYDAEQRASLATHLARELPRYFDRLTPDARQHLVGQLERTARANPELSAELRKLEGALTPQPSDNESSAQH